LHNTLNGIRRLPTGFLVSHQQIIAVVDVIESMATDRRYRHELGVNKALEEIERNAGKLYDSDVCNGALLLFRRKKYKFNVVPECG
jgi:HD-GYP domain-containing protein (c-di-GMP phosphodiesterase class II)